MKNYYLLALLALLLVWSGSSGMAQIASTSDNLKPSLAADRLVRFDLSQKGDSLPIEWGLDTAWPSEENIRRGVAFMGKDNVDVVRVSFQPTRPLVNGQFQSGDFTYGGKTYQSQTYWLNERLRLVGLTGEDTRVVMNCDHPFVDPWYTPSANSVNAQNWAAMIELSVKYVQDKGRVVTSVAPFNEPDYTNTGQGNRNGFGSIAALLKANPLFKDIRISGGNTLNCDQATPWYNALKANLDEGNTHQLAGSFDNYASFFQTVRASGHHATNDELHNVMEAMVGVEYGMQTGIWWGTATLARGEFCKASDGVRLGYAEHRPNWTAASVYRGPDGKVQAFGGTSERQAATTTYKFLSKDRAVYFDGYGPQREYVMEMPGGTGYQVGQTNAERVVNITWGDDIQPVIDGKYVLVNRASHKVIEIPGGTSSNATVVKQNTYSKQNYQQWNVTPVDIRIEGDFSYFLIRSVRNGKSLDILDWSLSNGTNIIIYDDARGHNQQWYLDYAEDGWFYIRSRWSAMCLEVAGSSTESGIEIQQREKNGKANQQWRLLPIDAPVEFVAPAAPANLTATANAVSVQLDWTAVEDEDLTGYTIFRSEQAGEGYHTIARQVTGTSFVDNTVEPGKPYFYTVRAVDYSLNRSEYSNEVSATASGADALVAHFDFEETLADSTINGNHSAAYGTVAYATGKVGKKALSLNGSSNFVQLPADVAGSQEITIAAWVYWRGTVPSQRIFDFGNGEDEYMYLTPRSSDSKYRFTIKHGGEEQYLEATGSMLTRNKWKHVAITLSAEGARLYNDGLSVAESTAITISPADFKPILNYIGKGQDLNLFYGYIDDFRIYNHALTAQEVAKLAGIAPSSLDDIPVNSGVLSVWPSPADDVLRVKYQTENQENVSTLSVFDLNGQLLMSREAYQAGEEDLLDVSGLPLGMYILKLTNKNESLMKKFVIAR
ncbi:RICIN domain-containing protein [Bacteroidales bacterium OttesenSCG-928-L03]|nr:RICIN domain-containing protein [Bacteroidales bacterium OttesenSCG-928-L03]